MIKIKTLNNGIRCVCEQMPYLHSISVGVWVGTGSRHESEEIWGISHFIEHMLFKGTYFRSGKEIAEFTDGFGGQLNAYTYRDKTCYYVTAVDCYLKECFDILSDMIKNSRFDEKDIESEKAIVFEEMNMSEDNPEELADDLIDCVCFSSQSLGRNILGNEKSVSNINKALITEYMKYRYTTDNMVISVAGNISCDKMFDLCEEYFGDIEKSSKKEYIKGPAVFTSGNCCVVEKNIEQTHINLAFKGISRTDNGIYALDLVNNILGGGVSSRLFQKIREDMGIAYSVVSSVSAYEDCGLTTLYAAVNPENKDILIKQMLYEVEKLKNDITEKELERSKKQVISSFILSSENAEGQMAYNGKQLIHNEKIDSLNEYIEKINNVTLEYAKEVLNRCFSDKTLCQAIVKSKN
ncbi:MAG: insulinase family protein [Clostridia bacterium]|nr:insulinase family protein [Clostridia bacterium]